MNTIGIFGDANGCINKPYVQHKSNHHQIKSNHGDARKEIRLECKIGMRRGIASCAIEMS